MAFIFPIVNGYRRKSMGFRTITCEPQTQISCFLVLIALFCLGKQMKIERMILLLLEIYIFLFHFFILFFYEQARETTISHFLCLTYLFWYLSTKIERIYSVLAKESPIFTCFCKISATLKFRPNSQWKHLTTNNKKTNSTWTPGIISSSRMIFEPKLILGGSLGCKDARYPFRFQLVFKGLIVTGDFVVFGVDFSLEIVGAIV